MKKLLLSTLLVAVMMPMSMSAQKEGKARQRLGHTRFAAEARRVRHPAAAGGRDLPDGDAGEQW